MLQTDVAVEQPHGCTGCSFSVIKRVLKNAFLKFNNRGYCVCPFWDSVETWQEVPGRGPASMFGQLISLSEQNATKVIKQCEKQIDVHYSNCDLLKSGG